MAAHYLKKTTQKVRVKIAHSDYCTLYFDKEVPTLKLFYDTVIKRQTILILPIQLQQMKPQMDYL